jgi:hypothetical protein
MDDQPDATPAAGVRGEHELRMSLKRRPPDHRLQWARGRRPPVRRAPHRPDGYHEGISDERTVREVEEYVLHPNEIRRMPDGVAAVRSMIARRHATVRVALPTGG